MTLDAVHEAKIPEIDAEFVRAFGIEDGDIDRFKADVRRNMERELKDRLKDRIKERVMDVLFEANPIELPKALVQAEMKSMADQMTQALGGGRMQLPVEMFESGARRRVALGLILGKIIASNGIEVDASRVREKVEQMASTYDQPQAFIDYYYADRSRLASVETLVLEEQVVDLVLEQLAVEDEPLSMAQLTNADSADQLAAG